MSRHRTYARPFVTRIVDPTVEQLQTLVEETRRDVNGKARVRLVPPFNPWTLMSPTPDAGHVLICGAPKRVAEDVETSCMALTWVRHVHTLTVEVLGVRDKINFSYSGCQFGLVHFSHQSHRDNPRWHLFSHRYNAVEIVLQQRLQHILRRWGTCLAPPPAALTENSYLAGLAPGGELLAAISTDTTHSDVNLYLRLGADAYIGFTARNISLPPYWPQATYRPCASSADLLDTVKAKIMETVDIAGIMAKIPHMLTRTAGREMLRVLEVG